MEPLNEPPPKLLVGEQLRVAIMKKPLFIVGAVAACGATFYIGKLMGVRRRKKALGLE